MVTIPATRESLRLDDAFGFIEGLALSPWRGFDRAFGAGRSCLHFRQTACNTTVATSTRKQITSNLTLDPKFDPRP